jgi:hypothetical protein
LPETKLHLRVDHSEEDALIEALMTTATAACADYLNMDAADLVVAVPAPVKSAALLLAWRTLRKIFRRVRAKPAIS